MQAQILFLKSADLLPFRSAVNAAVESRHEQVRKLWDDMLSGDWRGTPQGPISGSPGMASNPKEALIQIKASCRVRCTFGRDACKRKLISESPMKAVSVEEAVAMIPNGATVMVGGFMGVGTPERLLDELVRQRKSELSIISNDAAVPGKGVGKLFDASLVSTLTTSHIGLNPNVQKQMMANKVAVNLVPQGTFVERIRAGGCGLGGVLTPTGVGTIVEEGKRKIEIDGKSFLLETALRSDFALIHAFLADYLGNLAYALTARNFNPVMAMAADTVIVTAENIVPVGVIAPDHVVTPAPLVDYLIANG